MERWEQGGRTLGWDCDEVGGDFCGEGLEGFPSGFDKDVCDGWLFYCGEGDEDDFCAFDLRRSVGVFGWLA